MIIKGIALLILIAYTMTTAYRLLHPASQPVQRPQLILRKPPFGLGQPTKIMLTE